MRPRAVVPALLLLLAVLAAALPALGAPLEPRQVPRTTSRRRTTTRPAGPVFVRPTRPVFLSGTQFSVLRKALLVKSPIRDRLLPIPVPVKLRPRPPTKTLIPTWATKITLRRTTTRRPIILWRTTTRRPVTGRPSQTRTRTRTSTTATVLPETPGYIPPGCGTGPAANPLFLDCYVAAFINLRASIRFPFLVNGVPDSRIFNQPGMDWPDDKKQALRTAFLHAWNWVAAGGDYSATYPGSYPGWTTNGTVGGNIAFPFLPGSSARTLWDEPTAFAWYCAHVAHLLVLEVRALVPWTIRTLPLDTLRPMVTAEMWYTTQGAPAGPQAYGYESWDRTVSPAHPAYVWGWLQDIGALGELPAPGTPGVDANAVARKVIGRVLDFVRWNFAHMFGAADGVTGWQQYDYYWGLRAPSVYQMIVGTVSMDPPAVYLNAPWGWTPGCFGTTAFLQKVLRSIGIPVLSFQDVTKTCSHYMTYFPTLDAYLSHGDDPYSDTKGVGPYVAPGEALLMEGPAWRAAFEVSGPVSCRNVGIRPIELQVDFGWISRGTFGRYCYDLAAGIPVGATAAQLANSAVRNSWWANDVTPPFTNRPRYTAEQLLAKGLWTKLEQVRQELGCGIAPGCWAFACPDGSMSGCALCGA
ncbi:hypothetical protein DFJ74DRAFT_745544 [Hyaloraphidium curvatum]|nr:hypothetical protein DFJ74DRAFT_745544 [Hyaloraphidium curvatum]